MKKQRTFWEAACIRALRTMAQSAIALISVDAVYIADVPWVAVLSGTALAGILSLLTSISTGLPEVDE